MTETQCAAVSAMAKRKQKIRNKPKAAKPAAEPVPERAWTPDQPLRNKDHERFAVLVACREKHGMNQTEVYRSIYGGPEASARAHAARLVAIGNIKARINWLLDSAAKAAEKELGIEKIDLARMALGYIQTPVTDVLDAVNLWYDEKKVAMLGPDQRARMRSLLVQADSVKAGMFGYEVRLPRKLDSMDRVCKIMRWTVDDINLTGKLEVDFAAVLDKLRRDRQARINERQALAGGGTGRK